MPVSNKRVKGNTTNPAVSPLLENAELFYGRLVPVMLTIKGSKFDEKSVHQSLNITFDFIVLNMVVVWLLLVILLIRSGGSISDKTASSAACVVFPLKVNGESERMSAYDLLQLLTATKLVG